MAKNGVLQRLRYYKGQILTPQDFEDQQQYHKEKLATFLRRFPYGIIGGLEVTCELDGEGITYLLIHEGVAVDRSGNQLTIAPDGCRVELPSAKEQMDGPYLSLRYSEEMDCAPASTCGNVSQMDRVSETVEVIWTKNISPEFVDSADTGNSNSRKGTDAITVAMVTLLRKEIEESDYEYETCGDFAILSDRNLDNDIIRIAAAAFDETKIQFTGTDDGHDHTGGSKGKKIPREGLESEVSDRLVDEGNAHDHTATSGGSLIPQTGLEQAVRDQLIPTGVDHNHTGGREGAQISHSNLLDLTTDTNPHETTAQDIDSQGGSYQITALINTVHPSNPDAGKITEDGLHSGVKNQLIPTGVDHNHTGDENGAQISHTNLSDLTNPRNPHQVTANDIDTQGGSNKIVEQINAGNGVIAAKNLVLTSGWLRLPFLAHKYRSATEFESLVTHSVSGSSGATGVMIIPVPPRATKVTHLSIAGNQNDGVLTLYLYRGGKNGGRRILSKTIPDTGVPDGIIGVNPFDETFTITDTANQEINAESEDLGLYVDSSAASDIWLVAARFE